MADAAASSGGRAGSLYSGYEVYQQRAGSRVIPVVVLTPASPAAPSARSR